MPQEVDASVFIKALDARLPSVEGKVPTARLTLPVGIHHAALKTMRHSTYKDAESGRQIFFLNWDWQCLSTQGKGEAYKRRVYSWFMRLDPKAEDDQDLANFKGYAKAIGLVESCQNSIGETIRLLEDPKLYHAETKGLIPHIEFKITQGSKKNKREEFPLFANFIRRIEPTEVGVFDDEGDGDTSTPKGSNGGEVAPVEEVEEEVPACTPTPEEVFNTLDLVEVRALLQEFGVSEEACTNATEEDARAAGAVIAATGHGEALPWSVASEALLASGLGITKGRRSREDVRGAILEKLMAHYEP